MQEKLQVARAEIDELRERVADYVTRLLPKVEEIRQMKASDAQQLLEARRAFANELEPLLRCEVCHNEDRAATLFPCKHEPACGNCGPKLQTCPVCNGAVASCKVKGKTRTLRFE
eukprot:TRINITY_DN16710_c0_g1_i1.p2 TRINITY_DN16710_c0_g1~~TRINITY_DN16710_c0_g1_i1.p2  ORF type:complete len:115 (+),score=27.97 TRINITY_DN16710_c0_g1_i1:257-601(+)